MLTTITSLCNICLYFSECLREDITYENIEPVSKSSYDDDETVKVNCVTGFIGFYRLKCKNGQWLTFIARSCSSKKNSIWWPHQFFSFNSNVHFQRKTCLISAEKKCGHPGETANGDFKLIEGRDYTYGATVEYTCKKG